MEGGLFELLFILLFTMLSYISGFGRVTLGTRVVMFFSFDVDFSVLKFITLFMKLLWNVFSLGSFK